MIAAWTLGRTFLALPSWLATAVYCNWGLLLVQTDVELSRERAKRLGVVTRVIKKTRHLLVSRMKWTMSTASKLWLAFIAVILAIEKYIMNFFAFLFDFYARIISSTLFGFSIGIPIESTNLIPSIESTNELLSLEPFLSGTIWRSLLSVQWTVIASLSPFIVLIGRLLPRTDWCTQHPSKVLDIVVFLQATSKNFADPFKSDICLALGLSDFSAI